MCPSRVPFACPHHGVLRCVIAAGEQSVSSQSASSDPSAAPPGGSSRSNLQVDQRDEVMGAYFRAHHPIATVHVSAAAVWCTLLPCVLACVVMVYMTLMLCPWKARLLSHVFVIMRVAVDEMWLEHSVIGSHRDLPHCIVLWICSVYCIAVWLDTVEVRSHV